MAISIVEAVETVATMGSAMSGTIRAKLLEQLRRGSQTVGALSAAIGQGQPLVSHHLKLMEAAGVLIKRRDGRSVMYAVNGESFSKLTKAAELLSNAPKMPEQKVKVVETKTENAPADAPKGKKGKKAKTVVEVKAEDAAEAVAEAVVEAVAENKTEAAPVAQTEVAEGADVVA